MSDGQPVGWSLSSDKINELQQASIGRLVKRCKQAHFVDVRLRINGNYEYEQADWIKHMLPASTPQVSVECGEMFEAWHVNFYGKPVTPNVKETAAYKIWQAAWDARAPERESVSRDEPPFIVLSPNVADEVVLHFFRGGFNIVINRPIITDIEANPKE